MLPKSWYTKEGYIIYAGTVLQLVYWKRELVIDIQLLVGHNSAKTIKIYIHIEENSFKEIKDLLTCSAHKRYRSYGLYSNVIGNQ